MFIFVLFSKEFVLDELLDFLTIEDSELAFEITKSTSQMCTKISRFPCYYSSELYLSQIPDSIELHSIISYNCFIKINPPVLSIKYLNNNNSSKLKEIAL